MAKTLQQLLGYTTLTGIISSPLGGVPVSFDPKFYTQTVDIRGQYAQTYVVNAARQNATAVNYGSQSRKVAPAAVSQTLSRMVHYYEHVDHAADLLVALQAMDADGSVQNRGAQILANTAAEFRRRFTNVRTSAIASALRHGALFFNGNGVMLPTSSGAVQTVDLGVPAANKNQCASGISASWATASTDIIGDIVRLQLRAIQTTGLPLTNAYYGSGVINRLLNNTAVRELMKSDTMLTSSLRQMRIPEGFGLAGLKWTPLWHSHFRDASNAVQEWFPSDHVVFTPDVGPDWYQLQQGSYLVPTNIGGVSDNIEGAAAGLKEVFGMFSYAKQCDDPTGVRQWSGDTFLPVFTQPDALYIADTEF